MPIKRRQKKIKTDFSASHTVKLSPVRSAGTIFQGRQPVDVLCGNGGGDDDCARSPAEE